MEYLYNKGEYEVKLNGDSFKKHNQLGSLSSVEHWTRIGQSSAVNKYLRCSHRLHPGNGGLE